MNLALNILIIVVVAIIATIIIIGYSLENPRKAELTATVSGDINRVWELVTSAKEQESWRPEVTKIEVLEEKNGVVTQWIEHTNTAPPIGFREIERIQNSRYTIEIIPKYGISGHSTITFKDVSGVMQTELTFLEVSDISNPIMRILSRMFYNQSDRMNIYISNLEKAL